MMQCLFYKTLDDIKVRCQLCPHNCTIPNEELGTCGVRYNDSGKLVCHTSVSGLHTDPIEKKPLYHFYPGKQILSVGTYGCNLQCSFCQNHSISQYCAPKNKKPHLYNPVDIINRAFNQNNCIGIAFTYNEPTVWVEYMLEIAKLAKQNSLANAMVTNGYINPKPLDMILEFIDAFNIDLKGFSDKFYKEFTGGKLSPVLNTLKTIAKSGKHIEITYLVIPGLNDDETDFKKMAEWIASELGPSIPLHINRYYPA
ncbi:MAG: AmmeMemoRadiSam system radical SAM enzyme, partial [Perlabentimonas sp.]